MKSKSKIVAIALIGVMILTGCGTGKKASANTQSKTYDYSKEYAAATAHLEDCILDDETYDSLKDDLASYQEKNLKKLSKKDAKALKSTMEDIEDYYEASGDTIQDALVQIGAVYPTEDGFYDDAFKTSTTALLQDFNTLRSAGHYKKAAAKLNEITAAYTAYVESKGQIISADLAVDATKTSIAKDAIVSAKTGSKSPAGSTNGSASATAGKSTSSAGNNMAATGNASASVSSNGNATTGGNTTSNTASGGSNTNTTPSAGKNNSSSGSHGNTTNNTYTPTRTPYSWTCPECGAVITGYVDEDDNIVQHSDMHANEKADAFKYVTDADKAYDNWCASPECDVTISYDTWLDTHGYSSSLYHQYCNKYGW